MPLVTMKALHKIGAAGRAGSGRTGAELSARGAAGEADFAGYVVQAKSLRGSRYDPHRTQERAGAGIPPAQTLQVFLATPPWSLQAGKPCRWCWKSRR
ncbi:hypothetical protein M8494_06980 [Serratia ureilytica]